MGCDIHLHVEVKIDNQWHHYSALRVLRNYGLFSLMAGVRGSFDPIVNPRGIPSDITLLTQIDLGKWDEDAHTLSYLDSSELAALASRMHEEKIGEFSDYFGYFFGNDYYGREDWPEEIEEVRFVFWFDN